MAVDEAHGAHFPFCRNRLPHSAASGVDIWLHSAHKALGALTPGAFLHIGKNVAVPSLKFWLQVLQTSSPPYPLMISLDLIRRQMALRGKKLFYRTWKWATNLRYRLERAGLGPFYPGAGSGFALDPCRLSLLCRQGEGRRLAQRLSHSYRIELEISDRDYLLAIIGPAQLPFSAAAVARFFYRAWKEIPPFYRRSAGLKENRPLIFPLSFFNQKPGLPQKSDRAAAFSPFYLAPREAMHSSFSPLALENSPGEICAEMVVLSPPGIPLLSPGELIKEEVVHFLLKKRREGAFFQGCTDPFLKTIGVVSL